MEIPGRPKVGSRSETRRPPHLLQFSGTLGGHKSQVRGRPCPVFPQSFRLVFPKAIRLPCGVTGRPTLSGRCEESGSQEGVNIYTRKGLWEGNGGDHILGDACVKGRVDTNPPGSWTRLSWGCLWRQDKPFPLLRAREEPGNGGVTA